MRLYPPWLLVFYMNTLRLRLGAIHRKQANMFKAQKLHWHFRGAQNFYVITFKNSLYVISPGAERYGQKRWKNISHSFFSFARATF